MTNNEQAQRIKMGVIGAGNMGKNHVRIVRELKEHYDFVGVFEPNQERVKALGLEEIACQSEEELLSRVDAVVVAVPSSFHKKLGLMAADHGVHLLMEKPLALSRADAQAVVDAYEKAGKVLMVDHVERFNPVVHELEKILSNESIVGIEIKRCSPMDRRISDTDVIYDLMIHDVDILLNALMPQANVTTIAAFGKNVYSEKYVDYVQGIFQFENDSIASVISSRTTEGKIRKIRIHCETSYIDADLLHRTLSVARKTRYELDLGYTPLYSQENVIEQVFVPNAEPLKKAHEHFVECIRTGVTPITSGASALKSLAALDAIEDQLY